MPLVTTQDWIVNALRKCGQLRPGYTPQPELTADGLNEWAGLFDSWAAERSMGFSIPQYTYPVTGTGSKNAGNGYDIGPTATDWRGPRPSMIVRANCKVTGAGPIPFYIHLVKIGSAEEWAALSIRQIPGINITTAFYYDPQFPNGVFNVFPPLIAGNAIELFTAAQLAVPVDAAALYAAPPPYQDAILYSLAERLWPMCTRQIAVNKISLDRLSGTAYEAREKVRMLNRPIPELASDYRSGRNRGGYYDSNVTRTGLPI